MATATESASKPTLDQSALDAVVQQTQKQLMERPELLQMRMENETIMAECRVRPRDMKEIRRQLQEQLEAFPELADKAVYTKPVGKDDDGVMKFHSDLSIRAAEVLREVYGFNRVRSDVTPVDDDKTMVKIDATFTDFQNGCIFQAGSLVSAYYRAKGGGMRRIPEDRFLGLTVKAEASKCVREVILRSVNAGVKAWFRNECDKVNAKTLSEDKVDAIVKAFRGLGVELEQLEQLIGRPRVMKWTIKDRQTLLGVWNAIKDGETSVAQVFGQQERQQKAAPKTDGGATVEDLVNPPQAATEDNAADRGTDASQSDDAAEFDREEQRLMRNINIETGINKVRGIVKTFDSNPMLTDAARERLQKRATEREGEIRGKRGQRSNGGGDELFKTTESATEAGV